MLSNKPVLLTVLACDVKNTLHGEYLSKLYKVSVQRLAKCSQNCLMRIISQKNTKNSKSANRLPLELVAAWLNLNWL